MYRQLGSKASVVQRYGMEIAFVYGVVAGTGSTKSLATGT
jgi:hypothetical protein